MHDETKVMEEKMAKLKEMKEKFVSCLDSEIAKGLQCVDTKEAGAVTDMIKDLAEAEYYCCAAEKEMWEKCYYESIVKEMKEAEEEGRYGYNNRRYSSGRYAPAGRGHISGYMPAEDYPMMGYNPKMYRDWAGAEDLMGDYRMGYTGDRNGKIASNNNTNGNNDSYDNRSGYRDWNDKYSRYGKAYNEYQNSRRHYTETKSAADKEEMDAHASEHVGDTIATMREIWKTSDPNLKKRIKTDLTNLVGEMTI